mgnify:FL=1
MSQVKRICGDCQRQFSADQDFCPKCGIRYDGVATTAGVTVPPWRNRMVLVSVVGVGVLLFLAVGGVAVTNGGQDDESVPVDTSSVQSVSEPVTESPSNYSPTTLQRVEPFLGTWVGTLSASFQERTWSFSMILTLRWADGRIVGSTVFPESDQASKCQAVLINPRFENDVLLVDEVTNDGNCTDTTIRIERSGEWLRVSTEGSHEGTQYRSSGTLAAAAS